MKKIYLIAFISCISITIATAQSSVKFGLKGGLSLSNIHASSAGGASDNLSGPFQSIASFYIGATAEIPVGKSFSVVPGLSVIGKGAQDSEGSTKRFYIAELPVNILYNFYAGKDRLFIGGGPYIGYMVHGMESGVIVDPSLSYTSYPEGGVPNFPTDDFYKRFEYGVNIAAGYSFGNHISINAGYEFGLSNLINVDSDSFKIQQRAFTLGVGYSF